MATGANVLSMLLPEGGWVIYGDDYEGIQFTECDPITKKEFQDGFKKYDVWKAKEDAEKASKKEAILERIGLTADELKTIIG